MGESLYDGEFWLPPQFLADDQLLSLNKRGFFEDDFMAGLTGKLARSTLSGHSFAPNSFRKWQGQGLWSPQSTLCAVGSGHGSSSGSPIKESSPVATWDLLYQAAGEVARMRSPSPMAKTHHPHTGFYNRRLQAAKLEIMKQQEMLRQQRSGVWGGHPRFVLQNRATTIRPPPRQTQANGYVGAKRECAGTGVFLPRRNVAAPKKPGCSVIVPARVAQALNLNLVEMGGQSQLVPNLNGRIGRGRVEPGRKHEIRLPQEWTY